MWGKKIWPYVALLCFALVLQPAGLYGEEPELTQLPTNELLKKAVELCSELKRINNQQNMELTASREAYSRLEKEHATLKLLVQASGMELTAVKNYLSEAGNELQTLKQSFESLSAEAKSQAARANRAERSSTIWKIIAVAAAVAAATGWGYAAVQ